jgi:hypothetical protein
MKRKTVISAALALTLLLLSSCGAMSDMAAMDESKALRYYSDTQSEGTGFESRISMNLQGNPDIFDSGESTSLRKIIWDASMDIEAKDAAELHNRLTARAAELGGYEFTHNIQHHERHSVVNATYKIPPQHLQTFMAFAGDEGKVINRRMSSDDVTEGYYDASLRLESTRNSLAQYYRFMDEAENLDEVLRLQRIIDGIIEDIEAFEGRLRMWDILTDMATVSVLIRQENDPVSIRREINWNALTLNDMGYLIRNGFIAVTSTVFTVLQWVLIAVIVTSPLWITALAVLWIFLRRRKKRRAALIETHEEPPQE